MNRILVIGGTGKIGSRVIEKLAFSATSVRAMVRNPETAILPPQVEIVSGDLTLPDSLNNCLQDAEAVFLVWTAPPEAVAPALKLITSQVKRIVFLSAPINTPHPFFQASLPNSMSLLHEEIEQIIRTSGVEYTFLRPGMLASNSINWWAPQIRAGDLVRWPCLDAPTAPIDELDIASVAVHTLLENGHVGADYVLTGPQSLTQFEQLSTIGRVIGRKLKIEEISQAEANNRWNAEWPASVKNMLLKSWTAALGQPAYVNSIVEQVTGVSARTFLQWAWDNASVFQS